MRCPTSCHELKPAETPAIKTSQLGPFVRGELTLDAVSNGINYLSEYVKTDYTDDGWTELTNAYYEGISKIREADSAEKVNEEKNKALNAMAAVDTRPDGNYGSVTVTVQNVTFTVADGALWDGALVNNKTVELKSDSTMMSCIVEALAGYTVIGAETNYISSINGVAEFDGGRQSGWMGTLNDWFVNEGFSQFGVQNDKLHDGDVICVEYTCAFGADIRGGTEGNNDTTLYDLSLTGGTLTPTFSGDVTEYVFMLNEGVSKTTINFTNNNRAFQSRAYLNSYAPSANNWIRSGDSVMVISGDVITVGVGESVWPSMGSGTPTKYKITIVSPDDSEAVEALIDAIGNVVYSNYEEKAAAVAAAKEAYDALPRAPLAGNCFSLEGGDILNLSAKVLAVGVSARTQAEAVEILAENVLADERSEIETVLAFTIPQTRACMHLDTVFTQVDHAKFTVHPGIFPGLRVFSLKRKGGAVVTREEEGPLEDVLSRYLDIEKPELIYCGGNSPIAAAREQWNDGSNTLCIAPGTVIVYDRNYETNRVLQDSGIRTLLLNGSELSRGRGGPRCMSMPLVRE